MNKLCKKCIGKCKQKMAIVIIACPNYRKQKKG